MSVADDIAETFERDGRKKLLCFVGPTASGKTELAIQVAERVGGEILSIDSVQVYRHFDIGSGKATPEERARAPHHLLDLYDPHSYVDAIEFAKLAQETILSVRARNRVPILCGGTFFWMRTILFGLVAAPKGDPVLRDKHRAIFANDRAALHDELRKVDPASAERLHPNDLVRVSRALEVFELSGTPLSALQKEHGFQTPLHDAALYGIRWTPEELTLRIEARARQWISNGWLDEIAKLRAMGFASTRAMQSVGYKQANEFLEGGGLSNGSHDALIESVVRATRIFARRQRTWLGHENTTWV